jgi:hypothetical protein
VTVNRQRTLDALAVSLSGLCIIHCLALPLALTLFPIFASTLVDDQLFHGVLYVGVLPLSVLAFFLGYRHHRDRMLIIVGGIGLAILGVAAVFGHDWFGLLGERVVTSIGGLVLVCAHVINYRHSRAQHRH